MTQPEQSSGAPVPTPMPVRMRHARTRLLPIGVWLLAIAAAGWLLARQAATHAPLVGMVEIAEALVSPSVDGVLVSLDVELFDDVEAGDVIGRLDDSILLGELNAARAELDLRRAELRARAQEIQIEEEQRVNTRVFDLQRAALADEEARLDLLDRAAELEIARVELEGLESLLQRLEALEQRGFVDKVTYEETLYATRAARARVSENESALEGARELRENSARYRGELETALGGRALEVEEWLAPYEAAIRVQESLLEAFSPRAELLALRAPVSGRVTLIAARAGQAVRAGEPVLTITSTAGERVFVFVAESQIDQIGVGTELELLTRRSEPQVFRGTVSAVGSKMELLPERLQTHPLFPQFGLAVLVEDIPVTNLFPGELVDVRMVAN